MVKYNTTFLRDSARREFAKRKDRHLFVESFLGAKVYRDADIIPNKYNNFMYGGVVTSDGVFVENSALHEGYPGIYEYDRLAVDILEIPVIYVGFLYPCWGHVITDFIKKLWFLNSIEGRKWLSKGAKICYVSSDNLPPLNML